jgi:hypothetical protein
MILPSFGHGLRAADASEWRQVDFTTAVLHVRRVKKGTPPTHALGDVDWLTVGADVILQVREANSG